MCCGRQGIGLRKRFDRVTEKAQGWELALDLSLSGALMVIL